MFSMPSSQRREEAVGLTVGERECMSCGFVSADPSAADLVTVEQTKDKLCRACWCAACRKPLRRFGLTLSDPAATGIGKIEVCQCKTANQQAPQPPKLSVLDTTIGIQTASTPEALPFTPPSIPSGTSSPQASTSPQTMTEVHRHRINNNEVLEEIRDLKSLYKQGLASSTTAASQAGTSIRNSDASPGRDKAPTQSSSAQSSPLRRRRNIEHEQGSLARLQRQQEVEADLHHARNKLDDEASSLHKEIAGLELKKTAMLTDMERQRFELQMEHSRLELEVQQLRARRDMQEAEVASTVRHRQQELDAEVGVAQRQLRAFQHELEAVEHKLDVRRRELEAVKRHHETQVSDLKAEVERTRSAAASKRELAERDAEAAKQRAEEVKARARAEVEEAERRIATTKHEVEEEAGHARKQRHRLQKELDELRAMLETVRGQVLQEQGLVRTAEQARKSAEEERLAAANSADTVKTELAMLEERLSTVKGEVEAAHEAALRREEEEAAAEVAGEARRAAEEARGQAEVELERLKEEAARILAEVEERKAQEEALIAEVRAQKEAEERRLAEQAEQKQAKQFERNKRNTRVRQANKTIVLRRLSKRGARHFGFNIVGGYDVDGLQPHVSKIDEFGPAADSDLHIGDFVVSVNGQRYVKATQKKIEHAIAVAGRSGRLSLAVHRDYSGKFMRNSDITRGVNLTAEGEEPSQPSPPKRKLSSTPRRQNQMATVAMAAVKGKAAASQARRGNAAKKPLGRQQQQQPEEGSPRSKSATTSPTKARKTVRAAQSEQAGQLEDDEPASEAPRLPQSETLRLPPALASSRSTPGKLMDALPQQPPSNGRRARSTRSPLRTSSSVVTSPSPLARRAEESRSMPASAVGSPAPAHDLSPTRKKPVSLRALSKRAKELTDQAAANAAATSSPPSAAVDLNVGETSQQDDNNASGGTDTRAAEAEDIAEPISKATPASKTEQQAGSNGTSQKETAEGRAGKKVVANKAAETSSPPRSRNEQSTASKDRDQEQDAGAGAYQPTRQDQGVPTNGGEDQEQAELGEQKEKKSVGFATLDV